MVQSLAVSTKLSKELEKEYLNKLKSMSEKELLQEFLSYIDYTEESDSGKEFHPIYISSSRALITPCIGMLLSEIRSRT